MRGTHNNWMYVSKKREEKTRADNKSVNKRRNDFLVKQDHLLCQRRTKFCLVMLIGIFQSNDSYKCICAKTTHNSHMRTLLRLLCSDVNLEQWENGKEREREKENGSGDKLNVHKIHSRKQIHTVWVCDRKIPLDYRYWGESSACFVVVVIIIFIEFVV